MGAFTDFSEGKIVDVLLRNQTYTGAITVYLALFTAATSPETGIAGMTEANYTNYARVAATWTPLDVGTGTTKNAGTLTFPANGNPSASITISHIGIVDNSTIGAGNLLLWAPLSSNKTLAVGDVLAFATNAIVFTLD